MLKIKYKYVFLHLLFLICFFTAQGQNKAVEITSLGIQVGQQVPELYIANIHNYRSNTAKLSDFRDKLLILDFWATWCSPCVAMIPKMDSLQKMFGEKLQFLSVTYQNDDEVLPFIEKLEKQKDRHYAIPLINADVDLHKLFPHKTLPHYVWIDEQGKVVGITGMEEINLKNIENTINGDDAAILNRKRDIETGYDIKKPFLINGNGGSGENLIYHAVLTGYTEGIGAGYDFQVYYPDSVRNLKISTRNQSLIRLFKLAYGQGYRFFGDNSVVVEIKDDTDLVFKEKSGPEYENWYKFHSYCYELIVPHSIGRQAFDIMQNDLDRYFPAYSARVEKRKTMCLALVRTSKEDKLHVRNETKTFQFDRFGCKISGFPISAFIRQLDAFYLQNSPIPIVDASGYTDMIDLDIQCNLSNVEELNRELAKYDLKFVEKEAEIEMLVIKDNPEYKQQ